jgi:amino acid transporter
VFYVLAVLLVGLVVPYNSPRLLNASGSDASASPFVIAVDAASIRVLPHIVNAVLVTVTWSAANADLYAASRTLYAMSIDGQAPAVFKRCTKGGVPVYAVGATALFGPLAYLGVGSVGASLTFSYLYALSAVSIIMAWWAIVVTSLRFHYGLKAQGFVRKTMLPYVAPLQPGLSWLCLVMFTLVIIFAAFPTFIRGHWATDVFITTYLPVPLFFLTWAGFDWAKKGRILPLAQLDFKTGRRQLEQMDEECNAEEARSEKPNAVMRALKQ